MTNGDYPYYRAQNTISYNLNGDITLPGSGGDDEIEVTSAGAATGIANVNVYGIDPRGMSQFGEMIEINSRSD